MSHVTHKMDRAVNWTRFLGAAAIIAGVGLLGFALMLRLQDANNEISIPVAVSSFLFYILPGGILMLAWRMEKLELWAYAATSLLCLCFLVKYMAAVVMLRGGHIQFYESPIICETIVRLPAIYLFVSCLNAWSDVGDEYRNRKRRIRDNKRGFEPIMQSQAPMRTPPRPGAARSPTTTASNRESSK